MRVGTRAIRPRPRVSDGLTRRRPDHRYRNDVLMDVRKNRLVLYARGNGIIVVFRCARVCRTDFVVYTRTPTRYNVNTKYYFMCTILLRTLTRIIYDYGFLVYQTRPPAVFRSLYLECCVYARADVGHGHYSHRHPVRRRQSCINYR